MSWLPTFSAWQFATAGAICAAGPFLIHLLNRRRFRTVRWAAMDFLREALQRNRRFMQLRDLILMVLRTAAVLLFGLALARPFFSAVEEDFDASRPLHAVVVVDNSLSMGYQTPSGKPLLRLAQDRAQAFIKTLPPGSWISVVPLCSQSGGYSPDAYRTQEDAIAAVEKIPVVDRTGSFIMAANAARQAGESANRESSGVEMAKRFVFFGDQQRNSYPSKLGPDQTKDLPEMQVVDVADRGPNQSNAWIADFQVQNGLADTELAATFVVRVRYAGQSKRDAVQLTLTVGDTPIGTKTLSFEASPMLNGVPQATEYELTFQHKFNSSVADPGRPDYIAAKVALTPSDRLPEDDQRYLVVPVLKALPVLFVDQFGEDENLNQSKQGDTFEIRRLLSPVLGRGNANQELVRIRKLKFEQIDRRALEDVRLVVIAGVKKPTEKGVALLRQYLLQGGQVIIAADSDFDPEAWNTLAWKDGEGILPTKLDKQLVGGVLSQNPNVVPRFLAYNSLKNHAYFRIPSESDDFLESLYETVPFFKTARPIVDAKLLGDLQAAERLRLTKQFEDIEAIRERTEQRKKQDLGSALDQTTRARLEEEQKKDDELLEKYRPNWLLWRSARRESESLEPPADPKARESLIAQKSRGTLPEVRAAFDDGIAYMVEREIGSGRVMFLSSGFSVDWNNLAKSNAFLAMDRVVRDYIRSTLPARNFVASDAIQLPISVDQPNMEIELSRPGETTVEKLDAGFIGPQTRGVTIKGALRRGLYLVTAYQPKDIADPNAARKKLWQIPLAIGGNDSTDSTKSESEVAPITQEDFTARTAGSTNLRWVGEGEKVSLAGVQIRGQDMWKYLIALVLIVLLVEMAILAWPRLRPMFARKEEETAV